MGVILRGQFSWWVIFGVGGNFPRKGIFQGQLFDQLAIFPGGIYTYL